MIDPKQQKRGFGAFAAREHETSDARAAAAENATPDVAAAPTADAAKNLGTNGVTAPAAGVTPATGAEPNPKA